MSVLSKPYFHDEEAAFRYLESIVWAGMPVCPHCGGVDRITSVKANPAKRIRVGLHRCGDCKGQFTVKVGTVFEHMRIPLHKALQAVYLMTSSKKGISAHQLHRVLEITYKTAWFLAHRIREAMRDGSVITPFGSDGGIVEVDETFIGHLKGAEKKAAYHHKMKVLALVDRDTGKARTMVVEGVTAAHLMPIINANVAREAKIMTDEHWAFGCPAAVKGNHVHTWADNRDRIAATEKWILQARQPVPHAVKRVPHMLRWFADHIKICLYAPQHGFDFAPKSDMFGGEFGQ